MSSLAQPSKTCSACGVDKPREAYSKKQYNARLVRRCVACVDAGATARVPASADEARSSISDWMARKVVLKDLRNAPELNGKHGIVVAVADGRCCVRGDFGPGRKHIKVLPEKLCYAKDPQSISQTRRTTPEVRQSRSAFTRVLSTRRTKRPSWKAWRLDEVAKQQAAFEEKYGSKFGAGVGQAVCRSCGKATTLAVHDEDDELREAARNKALKQFGLLMCACKQEGLLLQQACQKQDWPRHKLDCRLSKDRRLPDRQTGYWYTRYVEEVGPEAAAAHDEERGLLPNQQKLHRRAWYAKHRQANDGSSTAAGSNSSRGRACARASARIRVQAGPGGGGGSAGSTRGWSRRSETPRRPRSSISSCAAGDRRTRAPSRSAGVAAACATPMASAAATITESTASATSASAEPSSGSAARTARPRTACRSQRIFGARGSVGRATRKGHPSSVTPEGKRNWAIRQAYYATVGKQGGIDIVNQFVNQVTKGATRS